MSEPSQTFYERVRTSVVRSKVDFEGYVQFSFDELPAADFFAKVDFITAHSVYFSTYFKAVERHGERFYAEVNALFAAVDAAAVEGAAPEVGRLLFYFRRFLAFKAEERLKLCFSHVDKLVLVLERCPRVEAVVDCLHALRSLFSLSAKNVELLIFGLGQATQQRLCLALSVWAFGPRACNSVATDFDRFELHADSPLNEPAEQVQNWENAVAPVFAAAPRVASLKDGGEIDGMSCYGRIAGVRRTISQCSAGVSLIWLRAAMLSAASLLGLCEQTSLAVKLRRVGCLLGVEEAELPRRPTADELRALIAEDAPPFAATSQLLLAAMADKKDNSFIEENLPTIKTELLALGCKAFGSTSELALATLPPTISAETVSELLCAVVEAQEDTQAALSDMETFLKLLAAVGRSLVHSPSAHAYSLLSALLQVTRAFIPQDKNLLQLEVLFGMLEALLESPGGQSELEGLPMAVAEVLEKVNRYFIEQLSGERHAHASAAAAVLLERPFWGSPPVLELMGKSGFESAASDLMILFNDLLEVVEPNLIGAVVSRFEKNGFLECVFGHFERGGSASEIDSLAFFLDLLSKVRLGAATLSPPRFDALLSRVFALLFTRDQTAKNVWRFLPRDSFEAVKNFSEKVADTANAHADLERPLARWLLAALRGFGELLAAVDAAALAAADPADLVARLRGAPAAVRAGYFQSQAPTVAFLAEELGHIQKGALNVFGLLHYLFNNHKCNVYKELLALAREELGCGLCEFVFERAQPLFAFDLQRHIHLAGVLVNVAGETNNRLGLEAIAAWVGGVAPHVERMCAAGAACTAAELRLACDLLRGRDAGVPPPGRPTPACLAFYRAAAIARTALRVHGNGLIHSAELFRVDGAALLPALRAFAFVVELDLELFRAHVERYVEVYFCRMAAAANRGPQSKDELPRFGLLFDEHCFRRLDSAPPLASTLVRAPFVFEGERRASALGELGDEIAARARAEPTDGALFSLSVALCAFGHLAVREAETRIPLRALSAVVLPVMAFAASYLSRHSRALRRVFLRCVDARPSLSVEEATRAAFADLLLADMFGVLRQILAAVRRQTETFADDCLEESERFGVGVAAFAAALRPESLELFGLRERVYTSEARAAESVQKDEFSEPKCERRLLLNFPRPLQKLLRAYKQSLLALFETRLHFLVRAQTAENLSAVRRLAATFGDLPALCSAYPRYADAHFLYPSLLRSLRNSALAELEPRCLAALAECVRAHFHRFAAGTRSPARPTREESAALPAQLARLAALLAARRTARAELPSAHALLDGCAAAVDGRRLGELVAALFALLAAQEQTAESRAEIAAFALHVLEVNRRAKPRLMNEASLGACLEALAAALAPEDALSETLLSRNAFELPKAILRVELADALPATNPLFAKLRALLEAIFCRPSALEALFRAEIVGQIRARKGAVAFAALARYAFPLVAPENEESFARAFQSVARTETRVDGKFAVLAELRATNDFRGFLHEFAALLLRDLRYKFDLRRRRDDRQRPFGDVFLCDALFFQLFPRFPQLYARGKSAAHIALLDAAFQLSPLFAQFLRPLFFNSQLTDDEEELNESVIKRLFAHAATTADGLLAALAEDGRRALLVAANVACVLLYCCSHEKFFRLFRDGGHVRHFCAFYERFALAASARGLNGRALTAMFNISETFRQREIVLALGGETRGERVVPNCFRRHATDRPRFRVLDADCAYYDLRARLPATGARLQRRVFVHRVERVGNAQIEVWEQPSRADSSESSSGEGSAATSDPFAPPNDGDSALSSADSEEYVSPADSQIVEWPEQTETEPNISSPSRASAPPTPGDASPHTETVSAQTDYMEEEEETNTESEAEMLHSVHIEMDVEDEYESEESEGSFASGEGTDSSEADTDRSQSRLDGELGPTAKPSRALFEGYPFAYPLATVRGNQLTYFSTTETNYFNELLEHVSVPLAIALHIDVRGIEREFARADTRFWSEAARNKAATQSVGRRPTEGSAPRPAVLEELFASLAEPPPAPAEPAQVEAEAVPREFDAQAFEAFGAPPNFLEVAGLDPEFFRLLPYPDQVNLVLDMARELRPPEEPQGDAQSQISSSHRSMLDQQNENVAFIATLSGEMRREVLLTCPPEFLFSLPEALQQEAHELRHGEAFQGHFERAVRAARDEREQPLGEHRRYLSRHHIPALDALLDASPALLPIEEELRAELLALRLAPFRDTHIAALLFHGDVEAAFFERAREAIAAMAPSDRSRLFAALVTVSRGSLRYLRNAAAFDRWAALASDPSPALFEVLLRAVKCATQVSDEKTVCELQIGQTMSRALVAAIASPIRSVSRCAANAIELLSFNESNFAPLISELREAADRLALALNLCLSDLPTIATPPIAANAVLPGFDARRFLQNAPTDPATDRLLAETAPIVRKIEPGARCLSKVFSLIRALLTRSSTDPTKKERLKSVAAWLTQPNLRRLFMGTFRGISLFEPFLQTMLRERPFARPIVLELYPLLEAFLLAYQIVCEDDSAVVVGAPPTLQLSSFSELLASPELQRTELNEMSVADGGSEASFEAARDCLSKMFTQGCLSVREILNYMLSEARRPFTAAIGVVARRLPKIFSFAVKKKYFGQRMASMIGGGTLELHMKRERLLGEAFEAVMARTPVQLRGRLAVRFEGEEGQDQGGLAREFFALAIRAAFDVNNALFVPAAHGHAFQPATYSAVNAEHLRYFQFVGRVIGLALLHGHLVDAHFTRAFYKHMTGAALNFADFEDYDPEYYQSVRWLLEHSVEGLELTFTHTRERFGQQELHELREGGADEAVTDANKAEYVRLLCSARMGDEIREQLTAFLQGLADVVPREELAMFEAGELELLLCGVPEIDVDDLRENTIYIGYTKDARVVLWFWEILADFDQTMKAGFLQFVTGSSKVPFEGFKALHGVGRSVQRFTIYNPHQIDRLPSAHTCMNQLDLPDYSNKEVMRAMLEKAIVYGKEGFALV